jgi:hypothetical protein
MHQGFRKEPLPGALIWRRTTLKRPRNFFFANYDKFPEEPGPASPGVIPWWRLRASKQIKLALEIKFG